jgi:hypothetical protein
MSEEKQDPTTEISFYDKVNWDIIKHNKISRDDFLRIKAKHKKAYATLLGAQDELNFFMFKALMWPEYKEMKQRNLNKYEMQEFIINSCVLWPKQDAVSLNTMESGIMTTLVYQIMATSYFLNDPTRCLEMILEV